MSLSNGKSVPRIAHVALWTTDLEATCRFWERVHGATVGPPYASRNRPGFESRFLKFAEGPTFEVMNGPWVAASDDAETAGFAHVAISVGSEDEVNRRASLMKLEEALVLGPRWTKVGFYESAFRDPALSRSLN